MLVRMLFLVALSLWLLLCVAVAPILLPAFPIAYGVWRGCLRLEHGPRQPPPRF